MQFDQIIVLQECLLANVAIINNESTISRDKLPNNNNNNNIRISNDTLGLIKDFLGKASKLKVK
jgi:hypothetical protein